MVKKRIVKKPEAPQPEDWINKGGIDPEITPPPPPPPAEEEKGKAYPHRISFDMDTAQYKRLKRSSFEEERSMNEILREAVEQWLRSRNY